MQRGDSSSKSEKHVDELDLPEEKRRAVTAGMDIIDGELAISHPNQTSLQAAFMRMREIFVPVAENAAYYADDRAIRAELSEIVSYYTARTFINHIREQVRDAHEQNEAPSRTGSLIPLASRHAPAPEEIRKSRRADFIQSDR
jgi:hypothetical protein